MIISRTPLRISFGGGQTDIPEFYNYDLGMVVNATINKYIYITVNKRFEDKFRIAYKKYEEVDNPEDISHPIIRECIKHLGITDSLEITTVADIPGGTGLGSSSSFTVGLLNALHRLYGHYRNPKQLAEEACHIELDHLKRPMGKQDQYAAAFGGLNNIIFTKKDIDVNPIYIRELFMRNLENKLSLHYLNTQTKNDNILKYQIKQFDDNISVLEEQRDIAWEMTNVLKEADRNSKFTRLGELMNESWKLKKKFKGVTNKYIDELYQYCMDRGVVGGKVCGAGARGFLLLYIESDVKGSLKKIHELRELPFKFEREGSKIIYED